MKPFKTTTFGACNDEQKREIERRFGIPLPPGTQVEYDGNYLYVGCLSLKTIKRIDKARRIVEACDPEGCMMCTGEACWLCGAGCWNSSVRDCAHDVMERHQNAPDEDEVEPGSHYAIVDYFSLDNIKARLCALGLVIK